MPKMQSVYASVHHAKDALGGSKGAPGKYSPLSAQVTNWAVVGWVVGGEGMSNEMFIAEAYTHSSCVHTRDAYATV